MDKLYIVIPAYNEEENIETVAREWHDIVVGTGPESRLLIIDDGSKDSTYLLLCELKKELPQLEPKTKPNSGHGSTLLYGYQYAIANKADYIFQTDSDGQTHSSEFVTFWEKRNDYSILIGYRNHRKDGIVRIYVAKVLKLFIKCTFGLNVTDANTPYRLMKSEVLEKYISKVPEDFNLSNVLITILFMYYKESVLFLPITFRQRQGGVNSINLCKIIKIGIRAIKDFVTIKKTLK